MTFLEAALAILNREGQPLHFKKLTEIALKENLLTVVGRSPEATMQQRLNDALKKDPSLPLTREKPGIFGLRYYPPTEKAAAAETVPASVAAPVAAQAHKEAAAAVPAGDAAQPADGEERKRRRRRGGRGRKKPVDGASIDDVTDGDAMDEGAEETHGGVAAKPATSPSSGDGGATLVAPASDSDGAPPTVPARVAAPPNDPARRTFAEAAAMVAAAHGRPAAPHPASTSATPAEPGHAVENASSTVAGSDRSTTAARPAPTDEARAANDAGDESEVGELDTPTGPLIAPALGTEELVRGEDHRPVFEGGGRRRGRDRDHRGQRGGRDAPHSGPPHRDQRPTPQNPPRHPTAVEARPDEARPAEARPVEQRGPGTVMSVLDAAVEILRGSDGRPMHAKQIVELALKRNLLRGDVVELGRALRVGALADLRAREANGLRARVRPVGGGQLVLGDRKLEGELSQYERELGERALRLNEATRVALHRRLARLAPPAFESLARLVLSRLGIGAVELVKRGDGVVYLGGERSLGVQKLKVLIAVRPGEGELKRRAVGEFRAGLKARSFDEGVCLAAGRAGAEAIAELQAGPGPVELFDGDALATLCARHAIGVMKRSIAVDTLDVELWSELQES